MNLWLLVLLIIVDPSMAQIYSEKCIQCIGIDVYFHTIAYNNGSYFFNNQTQALDTFQPKIEANMEVLNQEFNETPFFFEWKNKEKISVANQTLWTENMCYYRSELNEWSFLGDFDKTINVYLGHRMKFGSAAIACATFPHYTENAIMMNHEILPPEGNGLALPHEVGHWLGLWHVYTQSFGQFTDPCNPENPGDFVDDTPLQDRFPLFDDYTNETSWDSCPGQLGEDSFWNIMNRVCPRRECFQDRAFFTKGQVQRMYDNWLIIRDNFESCSDLQRLLDFYVFQTSNTNQLILFDGNGEEVFNLRTMWFSNADFRANVCLSSDEPYVLAFYRYPSWTSYYFEYSLDGEEVATKENTLLTSVNAVSTLLLPFSAEPESPMNLENIYPAPTDGGGCAPNEARLEVIVDDSAVWLALFDATSQGKTLIGTRHCLPKGQHYSLLTGFETSSSAELLTITLNGLVVHEVTGPFFHVIYRVPRIVSTIITPRMLLLSEIAPTDAPVVPFAPVISSSVTPSESPVTLTPVETIPTTLIPTTDEPTSGILGSGACSIHLLIATIAAFALLFVYL